jgi:hypothetical protein
MQAKHQLDRTTAKGLSTPENRGVPGSNPGLAIEERRWKSVPFSLAGFDLI